VRVTSPRPGDDVRDEQQVLGVDTGRRRGGFNESFRAAVDRSYTRQHVSSPGQRCLRLTCVSRGGAVSLLAVLAM